jgi:uncharacterized protein
MSRDPTGRALSAIAFTPSVRRVQERRGSRAANERIDAHAGAQDRIGPDERAFIEEADTFFMASTGENGWPYVQHRGGPRGFLRVLDERTLGFADFAGNRQYISAGNLEHDGRVMLILVDFATRGRFKLWGRARIVEADADPALAARLAVPGYEAKVERACIVDVAAFDYNCPQHIVQRFSVAELRAVAAAHDGRAWLRDELGL